MEGERVKIIFRKKTTKSFVVSLCPVEVYEHFLMSEIKEKNKDGDNVSYDGYIERIGLKTIYLKFPGIVLDFIGNSEKDKKAIDLLTEILKNSKKITLLKKKKSIQICIYL